MYAQAGDLLLVEGDPERTALIIGALHSDGAPPYIVRWLADGHIAMVSPGQFARLVRARGPGADEQPPPRAGA